MGANAGSVSGTLTHGRVGVPRTHPQYFLIIKNMMPTNSCISLFCQVGDLGATKAGLFRIEF